LFVNVLIDTKASSLALALSTEDNLDVTQSKLLLNEVRASLKENNLNNYHILW
jgi:hypothetical protein